MAAPPTEGRALTAALSAPTPFRTRGGTAALHAADRHIERFAPEGDARRGRGGLGALAFVDRLVMPWVTATQQSASMRMFGHYLAHGPGQRAADPVSWLFPRPWFQDELDWMAAARAGRDEPFASESLFTTRGTYAARPSAAAQAAPSPATLGFVAPSLAAAPAAQRWSPLVGGDAAASARLVQLAVETSGDAAGRQLAASAMSTLAPALVGTATATTARAPALAALPALRARLAALTAAPDAAAAQPASRLAGQAPARVMPAVTADGFTPDEAAAPAEAPGSIAVPAPTLPLGLRMIELLAHAVEAGQVPAPVAGPRLAMPAGLGGLVGAAPELSAIDTLASGRLAFAGWAPPPSVAPTAAPPAPLALSAIAQTRPHALEHVAWSDRWLARMAGAQPRALAAFDAATTVPAARTLARATAAPAPVFVAPAAPDVAPAAAAADRIVRYDDTDVTPDEVLFAIAAARAQPARRPVATPPAAAGAAPARPGFERITPADAILTGVPAAPGAGLAAALASSPVAPALAGIVPMAPAPTFDVRALFGGEVAAAYLGGLLAASTFAVDARGGLRAAPSPITSRAAGAPAMAMIAPAAADDAVAPPTTLRAPLLWPAPLSPLELGDEPDAFASAPVGTTWTPSASGEEAHTAPLWSALPGMTAERSRRWATHAQESAADLSYDFVSPELVLAARAYGLSPADAAQASRLAAGGATGLQVLAGNVEMTFLSALDDAGRAGATAGFAPVTAFPIDGGGGGTALGSAIPSAPRRAPRGAFLWPAATVGALDLRAAQPDGESALSVAALELLAASAVAQLGTFAIPPGTPAAEITARAGRPLAPTVDAGHADADADADAGFADAGAPAQHARFQALYLALTQAGPAMSTAGQAARAFALAGRGDGGASLSARERAALAWSVLPMISDGGTVSPEVAAALGIAPTSAATPWSGRAPELTPVVASAPADDTPLYADSRPGLGRAGEALSSFVSPVAAAPAPVAASSSGPASRAPSAAPELVRTAAAGRFGGGETEIPAWFEQAAKKMLENRGVGDNLSLAELTLVTAAPQTQIAASGRGQTVTAAAPTPQTMPAKPGMPDIDKIAQEVYAEFIAMMDTVRWRNNGEP